MQEGQFNQDFFQFLTDSPTPFHAVAVMAARFQAAGFHKLFEAQEWNLEPGNAYFVIRDNGALAAFTLAAENHQNQGFRFLGAHTDSPSLQIKPLAGTASHSYFQIGVEVYGGPLLATWFDRDLSIAGRVACTTADNQLATLLIDFKRPVAIIPSLAIHLDREANNGRAINKQKELVPILSQTGEGESLNFSSILVEQINREHPEKKAAAILAFDLFFHDCQPPSFLGMNSEFITGSRLDNLLSCFTGYTAMIETRTSDSEGGNSLMIFNNHEEIGSLTASGAKGTFLQSILERITPDPVARQRTLRKSFFISMDNAHGIHPNFSDKSDPEHLPLLNHGPVIKTNANQHYATTSVSAAIYKTLAAEAGVNTQEFVMRSDMACGSTIGPHTAATLGIPTVDIGAPTLAMHSIREITGSRDPFLLYQTISHYLSREELPRSEG
ncbi:MAG: M18 family aminopeptidase [Desulfobulbaceae bacterium]|nr:M18 family aminopeptidase [Desulfobulbaceae bacterium]